MRMWKRKTARIRFILLAGFMIFVTAVCRSVNGRQETLKRTDEGIELCHEIKEVIDQEAMGRAMEGETPEEGGEEGAIF